MWREGILFEMQARMQVRYTFQRDKRAKIHFDQLSQLALIHVHKKCIILHCNGFVWNSKKTQWNGIWCFSNTVRLNANPNERFAICHEQLLHFETFRVLNSFIPKRKPFNLLLIALFLDRTWNLFFLRTAVQKLTFTLRPIAWAE